MKTSSNQIAWVGGIAGVILLLAAALYWNAGNIRDNSSLAKFLGLSSAELDDAMDASNGELDDEEEHNHIDISAAAVKSLGLRLEEVTLKPYVRWVHLPGMIVEKPGQSGLSITSPIQGVVTQIHRLPGQALEMGDLIFTMKVTDEALEAAQLSLLDTITRLTVTEREIDRLDPLTESGAVIGRRKLEMEYQRKQLLSEQAARLQELRLRGLSTEQIQQIVDQRELVNEIEVRLNFGADSENLPRQTLSELKPIFTIEKLNVYPGLSVRKGEELCHIANHHELYLQGEAFPSDLNLIREALQQQLSIRVEFGEGDSREVIEDLTITYMDNHADPVTQTFPFYIALPNQIVGQRFDSQGRQFVAWKYKPGQRAHIYAAAETWPDQIVLPRDAVVRSGPEAFVFVLENDPLKEPEEYQEMFDLDEVTPDMRWDLIERVHEWELEPVAVQILHRDQNYWVLAKDQDLEVGDLVIVNRAYQVYLAWKLMMSGGGGHHHDHDN